MTQDQIIQTLHKVIAENMNFTTWTVSTPHLVALVNHAIEAEREACAKVCELMWHEWLDSPEENEPNKPDAEDCYRAIRRRGQA